MESELKRILGEELVKAHPQIASDLLYKRCVDKYVDAMVLETHRALALNLKGWNLKEDEFAFSAVRAKHAAKRTGVPQQYNYHLMQQNPSTALLLESHKGFSKQGVSQLSVMRFNPIYEDLLMQELLNLKLEKNQHLLDDIEQNYTHIIDVDIASLRSFISNCKDVIATDNKGVAYKGKTLRNLAAAQQLMLMVHEADESNPHSAYLRERYKTDDCGRIYGQGYSLQRMSKEVRYAALGVCHQYDFKACAFAVMASLAHAIDPTLKIGAVLDYIRNRADIRKRIAAQTGIDEKLVKSFFTAVGFGAKLRNTHFSAIRRELGKEAGRQHDKSVRLEKDAWNNLGNDEYERLLANQTFTYIYEDLQQINATIIEYYRDKDLEINNFVYSNIDPNAHKLDKNGKRKKKSDYRTNAQKLAWIYQALETLAREQFEQLSGQKALLTTHDCIYFKQKLPLSVRQDITYELQLTFPYLNFEHTPIYPITTQANFDNRFAKQRDFESEHAARIANEEIAGKNHNPISFTQSNFAGLEYARIENEKKAWQQFARDAGLIEKCLVDADCDELELYD